MKVHTSNHNLQKEKPEKKVRFEAVHEGKKYSYRKRAGSNRRTQIVTELVDNILLKDSFFIGLSTEEQKEVRDAFLQKMIIKSVKVNKEIDSEIKASKSKRTSIARNKT